MRRRWRHSRRTRRCRTRIRRRASRCALLIGRAREDKQFLFLFVNNRLEGNAPMTILSVVEP